MKTICLPEEVTLSAATGRLQTLARLGERIRQPQVWSILVTFGYRDEVLREIDHQHAAARQLLHEVGSCWKPGDRLCQPLLAALEASHKLFSVGRIAFQSYPQVMEELGFQAELAHSLEAWIEQTHHFTQSILGHPFHLETMEECGQPKSLLDSLQSILIEVETATALASSGQKELATRLVQCYSALNRLELWYQRVEGFLFLASLQSPDGPRLPS